jgi:hypothetical protein
MTASSMLNDDDHDSSVLCLRLLAGAASPFPIASAPAVPPDEENHSRGQYLTTNTTTYRSDETWLNNNDRVFRLAQYRRGAHGSPASSSTCRPLHF